MQNRKSSRWKLLYSRKLAPAQRPKIPLLRALTSCLSATTQLRNNGLTAAPHRAERACSRVSHGTDLNSVRQSLLVPCSTQPTPCLLWHGVGWVLLYSRHVTFTPWHAHSHHIVHLPAKGHVVPGITRTGQRCPVLVIAPNQYDKHSIFFLYPSTVLGCVSQQQATDVLILVVSQLYK